MRAQHYNMKTVLMHAKELIDNEDLDPKFSDPNAYSVGEEDCSQAKEIDDDDL
jgi:hypothetical protein